MATPRLRNSVDLNVFTRVETLAGRGMSDAQIAKRLSLNEPTVHNYIVWILHRRKLPADRELIPFAHRERAA
jgi:DNA-binding CsgD family transcriptional regulator